MYEVVVGNIGTVYTGTNPVEAILTYSKYKEYSRTQYGRASGEDVHLFLDSEILSEYLGTNQS